MKKMGTLIMALVFALVLAGCPSSGGGGDGLGLPPPPAQNTDLTNPGNDDDSGGGGVTIPVVGISLDKTTLSLSVNQSGTISANQFDTLTPTLTPANASNKKVTWSSSNSAVATTDSTGLVTARAGGTAIITVTTADGNKTASCVVTVTTTVDAVLPTPPVTIQPSRPVVGISLDKTTLSLSVNQTAALIAQINPVNASNTNVTWSTSNPAVATVIGPSLYGLVTAKAAGTATITVTTADGNKRASCYVAVTSGDYAGTYPVLPVRPAP